MHHFFAMLSRMKYISRWGLMRNTRPETLSEHSLETAFIAHCLALLRVRRFGGKADPARTALMALFHDTSEILTGDLPTPVKYYNPDIRDAYKRVESTAKERLLAFLPEDLRADYAPLIFEEDPESAELVKAADKISALIKCLEEERMGNAEFRMAARSVRAAVEAMNLPEADCFLEEFLPSYLLTLDELNPRFEAETEPQPTNSDPKV